MIHVSATQLRDELFAYLDKAAAGEAIVIYRHQQEIARLISTPPKDWRDQMAETPQLLVTPEELLKPLDALWASTATSHPTSPVPTR